MKNYSLWVVPGGTTAETQNSHMNKRVVAGDAASPSAKMNQFMISETPIRGDSETQKWKKTKQKTLTNQNKKQWLCRRRAENFYSPQSRS